MQILQGSRSEISKAAPQQTSHGSYREGGFRCRTPDPTNHATRKGEGILEPSGEEEGSSVGAVQVKDADGDTTEYRTQKAVQDLIWKEVYQKRYHMAEGVPICQGKLRGEFGYSVISIAAKQVLAGTYEFDEDFHQGTKQLMEAITNIRDKVPIDSVDKIITREIWQKK